MGNIKIIKGVFDTKLELEHAGIKAGFPSPAEDYRHETLDFNRDYIRHPEASFWLQTRHWPRLPRNWQRNTQPISIAA